MSAWDVIRTVGAVALGLYWVPIAILNNMCAWREFRGLPSSPPSPLPTVPCIVGFSVAALIPGIGFEARVWIVAGAAALGDGAMFVAMITVGARDFIRERGLQRIRRRPLAEGEEAVLALLRERFGTSFSMRRVRFRESGDAEVVTYDCPTANLTWMAEQREDGPFADDDELVQEWLRSRSGQGLFTNRRGWESELE